MRGNGLGRKGKIPKVKSKEDCKDHCRLNKLCKSFNYDQEEQKCLLKKVEPNAQITLSDGRPTQYFGLKNCEGSITNKVFVMEEYI